MIEAKTACWDLSIFGSENRRKSYKIFSHDIYLPLSILKVENCTGGGGGCRL
jgi:hypothetical protein